MVHASDTLENAATEIKRFFADDEVITYQNSPIATTSGRKGRECNRRAHYGPLFVLSCPHMKKLFSRVE